MIERSKENIAGLREAFVKDLASMVKDRMNYMLYGSPDGPALAENVMPASEVMYMNIAKDVVGVVFSMTDDREDNGSIYRLTAKDGTVVPFCNPLDEHYLQSPGIIAMFQDAVNT